MHAPLAMKYRTEWRTFASLEESAAEWLDLAARAIEPNIFYEPAFALPAAKVFGRNAGAVIVRSASGRLAGLFPARRSRLGLIAGYVHPYAPLGLPLVDRDDPHGVIDAWLAFLAKQSRALLLPLLPAGSFADALAHVCQRRSLNVARFGTHERALLLPCGNGASYLEGSTASKGSKGLLRRRRRLAEQGELTHRTLLGADASELVGAFLTLEASGWKGRTGSAALRDPAIAGFFREAVTSLAAEGKSQGDVLTLNGEPIAAIVVLRSGKTAWAWKIAHDERYAHFSPGMQVALDATRTLLDDATIERADSCTAPGPHMIDRLWRERLALSDMLISLSPGDSLYFRFACAAQSVRRAVKSAAKRLLRR